MNNIMVSVIMITYNHKDTVEQAIESVLNQKVDFNFEIIIGDDASVDGTLDILKNYKKKYPDIIQVIEHNVNVGPTRNSYDTRIACKGKYIAVLEGDDYWNYDQKLKKQCEILEKNEYIGVVHSCNVLCDDIHEKKFVENFYRCRNNEYTFEDFKKKRFAGHNSSIMFKNIYLSTQYDYSIRYKLDRYTGDRTTTMFLVNMGKIYCIDEKWSTYRLIKKSGASNINSMYKDKNILIQDWEYEKKLDKLSKELFGRSFITNRFIAKNYMKSLFSLIKNRRNIDKETFHFFKKIVSKNKGALLYILPEFFMEIGIKIKRTL